MCVDLYIYYLNIRKPYIRGYEKNESLLFYYIQGKAFQIIHFSFDLHHVAKRLMVMYSYQCHIPPSSPCLHPLSISLSLLSVNMSIFRY